MADNRLYVLFRNANQKFPPERVGQQLAYGAAASLPQREQVPEMLRMTIPSL